MLDRIKSIFGSVRFWIVSMTAIIAVLQATSCTGAAEVAQQCIRLTFESFFEIVKIWLMAVVAIGTMDSVAEKGGASIGRAMAAK